MSRLVTLEKLEGEGIIVPDIWRLEARDIAKYPAVHRAARTPHTHTMTQPKISIVLRLRNSMLHGNGNGSSFKRLS